MFGMRWRMFRLLGIPVSVDASWLVILALLTLSLATGFPEEPGPGWHLVGMWVAPQHRGQGVADELVGAVCELARQSGAASVALWVTDVNDRARAFYRRLGFAPTGRRQLMRPGEWEAELSLPI